MSVADQYRGSDSTSIDTVICVVGSSSFMSRACMGSVNSLKLSTVQTIKGESVLWNDCPISTGILAMTLAAGNYCRTNAAGKVT